jgi:predicted amidohydrolase
VTGLRLGLLQYGVSRIGGLDDYARKLDRLVAEGAEGAELLVMPEYACMEVAAAFTAGAGAGADAHAELEAVCARAGAVLRIMADAARRRGVWLLPGTLPWREGGGCATGRR